MKTLLELAYIKLYSETHLNCIKDPWYSDVTYKYYSRKRERLDNIEMNYQMNVCRVLKKFNCSVKHITRLSNYSILHDHLIVIVKISENETFLQNGSILLNSCAFMDSYSMFKKLLEQYSVVLQNRLINTIESNEITIFNDYFIDVILNSGGDLDEIINIYMRDYYHSQMFIDLHYALIWTINGTSRRVFRLICYYMFIIKGDECIDYILNYLVISNSYILVTDFIKLYGFNAKRKVIQIATNYQSYDLIDYVINNVV